MAWIYLIIAGIFEVIWSGLMKRSEGFTLLIPSILTIITMLISFILLALAMKHLPLGTSYTIWTGIGAVGAFITGIIFFSEELSPIRVIAALLIISGIILMKISSSH